MNKKLVIPAFLFFFVFSLMLLSQEESKEKKKWEDERISITVDKVERADSFPERLKSDIPGYTPTYIQPKKGYDLVFIHMTIVEKRDLKIKPSELRIIKPNSPHLIDDQGKTHWVQEYQLNITIPEKKTGYLIFVILKEAAIPSQFKYIYQYREEPPKPQEIKFGQIEIDLSFIR